MQYKDNWFWNAAVMAIFHIYICGLVYKIENLLTFLQIEKTPFQFTEINKKTF